MWIYPYVFVITNSRQGFDILLPTIRNRINIYDSSRNQKKIFHHLRKTVGDVP